MAYFPFVPALDRRIIHTGTYSSGVTTWTLPCSAVGMNAIVLSSDFGAQAGTMIVPTSATGTTVTASGDYSAGAVAIGRTFSMNVVLSQLFRRDAAGQPDLSSVLQTRFVDAVYQHAGTFGVRATRALRAGRVRQLAGGTDGTIKTSGSLRAWLTGSTTETTLSIESTDHKPLAISGLEVACDVVGAFR